MSTTLLTIDEAAKELNVKPLVVKRAIALRLLNATMIGGQQFRIVPSELQKYVAQGAPRLQMPAVEDHDGGWLSLPGVYDNAASLEITIRGLISKAAPIERPANIVDGQVTSMNIPATEEMRALMKQNPDRSAFSIPGTPANPYATKADWHSVAKLSAILLRMTKAASNPASGLDMLYRTPEDFQRLTDEAWNEYQKQSVRVSKAYPAKSPFGSPATVSFGVLCSEFGASKEAVIRNML